MVAEKPPIASEVNTHLAHMVEGWKARLSMGSDIAGGTIWYQNLYLEVNRTDTFIFYRVSITSFARIISFFYVSFDIWGVLCTEIASGNTIKIELWYIIRKYAQKSAQVGNARAKRCMVCAQMLTMSILRPCSILVFTEIHA